MYDLVEVQISEYIDTSWRRTECHESGQKEEVQVVVVVKGSGERDLMKWHTVDEDKFREVG